MEMGKVSSFGLASEVASGKRLSQVEEALNTLESVITTASAAAERLEGRLSDVLRTNTPGIVGTEKVRNNKVEPVPLAIMIDGLTDRVWGINGQLESIFNRIEL